MIPAAPIGISRLVAFGFNAANLPQTFLTSQTRVTKGSSNITDGQKLRDYVGPPTVDPFPFKSSSADSRNGKTCQTEAKVAATVAE
ncbi:hypothetical protein TWF730_009473 [Orbilia blumenaviensis]|uniref:Uncharacterized protein n=1 Tax=Orbilia blumenaviensis TaxID=1796055 RepID=A0AAV9UYE2_9PEZI